MYASLSGGVGVHPTHFHCFPFTLPTGPLLEPQSCHLKKLRGQAGQLYGALIFSEILRIEMLWCKDRGVCPDYISGIRCNLSEHLARVWSEFVGHSGLSHLVRGRRGGGGHGGGGS